jgi:hypothetical protein
MVDSTRPINERVKGKQLFGDGRLSMIFRDESVDFGKAYEFGFKHGNGTEEAREALRVRLEDMTEIDEKGQREHLSLSSRSQFVVAEGVGSSLSLFQTR